MPRSSTAKLRKERGSVHGDFSVGAAIAQSTTDTWRGSPNWGKLNPVQKEALTMIAHKVQRILTGDYDFPDHWDDIAGYAHLPMVKPKTRPEAKRAQRKRSVAGLKKRVAAVKRAKAKAKAKKVAKKAVRTTKRRLSDAVRKKISAALRAKVKKSNKAVAKKAVAKKAVAKKAVAKKAVAKKSNVVRLRSRRSGQDLRNHPAAPAPTPASQEAS